jgi:hypothetical protein
VLAIKPAAAQSAIQKTMSAVQKIFCDTPLKTYSRDDEAFVGHAGAGLL